MADGISQIISFVTYQREITFSDKVKQETNLAAVAVRPIGWVTGICLQVLAFSVATFALGLFCFCIGAIIQYESIELKRVSMASEAKLAFNCIKSIFFG